MPKPGDTGGGSVWQSWLDRLQGYQPMDQTQIETLMPGSSEEQRALAVVNDLLTKTNAEKFLSPYYISALRRQASGGQLGQRQILENVRNEVPLTGGPGIGDFIKRFIASSPTGLGNVTAASTRDALQGLLSRLNVGKQSTEGYNSDLYNILSQSPVGVSKLLELGVTGPFAGIIQNALYNQGVAAPLQPNANDWLDFLLQALPGRGGYGWNPNLTPRASQFSGGW